MSGWLAGQKTTAQRLNDNAPFTANYTSLTANSAAATTATVVAITTPSITFRDGRAYRVIFKGLAQSSVAADQIQVQVKKTNSAGASYVDSFRIQAPSAGGNTAFYLANVITNTTGFDIVAPLVGCVLRVAGGTGNVILAASTNNIAYIHVEDIGSALDYPSAHAMA